MQYSFAAVLALAATAVASYSNDTVVYTTVVVDSVVTVCPGLATITLGGHTYTNTKTESSTITVTKCPCTIVKPVYTATSVYCNTCTAPSSAPVYPNASKPETTPAAPVYPIGTGSPAPAPSKPAPSNLPASGANKAFAMSGASLVGLMGLAAYIL